jgi:hypothetical protein
MQRYVVFKVNIVPYFGNFSGTGAAKTLSAVLASRIINAKLMVCPNDVVSQWSKNISRCATIPHDIVEYLGIGNRRRDRMGVVYA